MADAMKLSRRAFVGGAAAAGMALALGERARAAEAEEPYLIGGFTKMIQSLSYDETADATAQLGWDGIESGVRAGGQVLPERVEDDLPRLAEAMKKRNTRILVMATDIHNPKEPYTESVLRTASKLGITHYRLGQWRYKADAPIPAQLDQIRPQLQDLAALNKELGLKALFQNHSGRGLVGAAVWDIYELLKDIDPKYVASHFDIGHATVEGGYAWQTHFQLMQPFLGAVVVKDFAWNVTPPNGGQARWCPVGQGMISRQFFRMLKASKWSGPVTMHFEYPVAGTTPQEKTQSWLKAMAADTKTLKEWLA